MSRTNTCSLDKIDGNLIDPFSKDGKNAINKGSCSIVNIQNDNGSNIIYLGDPYSKEVMIARGYINISKKFIEAENTWKTNFDKVAVFKQPKILVTDGKNKNGFLVTPERGSNISRKLEEVKFLLKDSQGQGM